jgi:exodeoxyribonuclease V alpha subunit
MNPPAPTGLPRLAEPFGDFLAGLATDHREFVRETARALVVAEAAGHACLPCPEPAPLLASGVAGRPGELKPLICIGGRVYLRRLFLHEGDVAAALRARMEAPDLATDLTAVGTFLRACGFLAGPGIDWQAVAVAAGLVRPLAVISGGPGTGKTRTAAVLLAAVRQFQPGVRVALAAPTGKAAARLGESLSQTWAALNLSAGTVPAPMTLHRLLGASADGRRFRHGPENPLAADLVLVDEASMVDLALMSRLVAALRVDTRLVLLGDQNQLASVEAGFVLGDLCAAAGVHRFSAGFAERLRPWNVELSASSDGNSTVVELSRNHRFGAEHSLARLVALIRAGEATAAFAALSRLPAGDPVAWRPVADTETLAAEMRTAFGRHGLPRWQATDAAAALAQLRDFQILCAVKRGSFGRDGVNEACEALVEEAGFRRRGQIWYRGRPVLITANAPHLGLFNGDLGVTWPDAHGELQVWFDGPDGVRGLVPDCLPAHETAFALTVHKSQGSEFGEVLVILPPAPSPVCTRELLYTGLTRARQRATLLASPGALRAALSTASARSSGLAERIGQPIECGSGASSNETVSVRRPDFQPVRDRHKGVADGGGQGKQRGDEQ